MKEQINPLRASRLINNGCVVLLTSSHENKSNVMALAWHMPVSARPPMISVAVVETHFTAKLIAASQEFALNIPGPELVRHVHFCGRVSGRKVDKFRASGLTQQPAAEVAAPLIQECMGHIECRLQEQRAIGDHIVFTGDVVAAWADSKCFNDTWLPNAHTLHHLGGNFYAARGQVLEVQLPEGAQGPPASPEGYLLKEAK